MLSTFLSWLTVMSLHLERQQIICWEILDLGENSEPKRTCLELEDLVSKDCFLWHKISFSGKHWTARKFKTF